jgi:hypothetical protein
MTAWAVHLIQGNPWLAAACLGAALKWPLLLVADYRATHHHHHPRGNTP